MPDVATSGRIAALRRIVPAPPADVAPLRAAISQTISRQWERYVPDALASSQQSIPEMQFGKGRFIAEMYARACYSMLLVSGSAPVTLRAPIRAAALLPFSRNLTIRLGRRLLVALEHLLPDVLHRKLLLMSALMGMLDVVVDCEAITGQAGALCFATLFSSPAPSHNHPAEELIASLVYAARQSETPWQSEYWQRILQPAVHAYCKAEVLGAKQLPDPTGMGHRRAGLDAALKGMWYVVGSRLGLKDELSSFEQHQHWNSQQTWMADASLLMQMIDDWVDQDQDADVRLTPVTAGHWTLNSVAALYDRTIQRLSALLNENGIRSPIAKDLFVDLYKDYLHVAIDAMDSGLAA